MHCDGKRQGLEYLTARNENLKDHEQVSPRLVFGDICRRISVRYFRNIMNDSHIGSCIDRIDQSSKGAGWHVKGGT